MEYRNNKIRCYFSGSKAVIKLRIDVRWDLYVFCRNIESPIRVPQMPLTFHPLAQRKRFPSLRCGPEIQIVRPLESMAEKQPQLHSALGIVNHLRRRFG